MMNEPNFIQLFRRQTALAAAIISSHLKEGDSAIDATAGTGSDTLMMAECVGKKGSVYAFDVQEAAQIQTKQKLYEAGLSECLHFYLCGHEKMAEIVEISEDSDIKAIMFNLGYLPGSDHHIMTKYENTLKAVKQGLNILAKGGVMTICAYRHPEGEEERRGIEEYCRSLGKGIDAYKVETVNHIGSPVLYIINKRG